MEKLNTQSKQTSKSLRRLGQGHGTGRGKTAGRGQKGQNARSNRALSFEGGALPLIKRLPFRRGKGRNYSLKKKPVIVNLKAFALLPAKSIVDIDILIKHNIVVASEANSFGIKILGEGELTDAFTVKLPVSKAAREKIEKAGGSVE